ncbi:MAG: DUF2892 domain-containing protein [bacterium]
MTKNMGGVDRGLRALLGVVILGAGLGLSKGAWWGWLGLIPLATSFVGFCPAYAPFRFSTCKKEKPAS